MTILLLIYRQVHFKTGLNPSRSIIIVRCLNQSSSDQGMLYKARIIRRQLPPLIRPPGSAIYSNSLR